MASSNLEFPLKPSINGVSEVMQATVTEQLIEQYVRYPELLDGATQSLVGDRVEKFKKEMVIERFYRQFYAEYDKLEDKISTNVTAFVSSLFD